MRHERQGLEQYANVDPSLHFNTLDPVGPDWREDYMKKLMDRDYEGAHQIRLANDPKYKEETEPMVTVLKSEGARLKSCRDVMIEEMVAQEDSEVA